MRCLFDRDSSQVGHAERNTQGRKPIDLALGTRVRDSAPSGDPAHPRCDPWQYSGPPPLEDALLRETHARLQLDNLTRLERSLLLTFQVDHLDAECHIPTTEFRNLLSGYGWLVPFHEVSLDIESELLTLRGGCIHVVSTCQ